MFYAELRFSNENQPELLEFIFSHPLLSQEQRTVRGKTSGAYHCSGSFQWTSGVQALSLFFVRVAMQQLGAFNDTPLLKGFEGSAAASFDYALCRNPNWLLDMFGVDSNGCSLLRRLVSVTNSCRKRCGPVAVSLSSSKYLGMVKIFLEGQEISDLDNLHALEQSLLSSWAADNCDTSMLVAHRTLATVQTNVSHTKIALSS